MARFIFYENKKTGNYFLTRCESEPGESKIILPEYVVKNGLNYTYGIYSFAFWGDDIIKTLVIPYTVDSLMENCFAGSQIEYVQLQSLKPPARPNLLLLRSNAEVITFAYHYGRGAIYENHYWLDTYDDKHQLLVKIVEDKTVTDVERDYYYSLYMTDKNIGTMTFPVTTKRIETMAFLGVTQDVNAANNGEPLFVFDNTSSTNTIYDFTSNNRNIVEHIGADDVLIKGAYAKQIDYDILSENCFYGDRTLSNLRSRNLTLSFNGKEIQNLAFQNCTALTQLTILDSIEYIAHNAFLGCDNLQQIIMQNTGAPNQKYYSLNNNGCIYYKDIDDTMIPVWYAKCRPISVTNTASTFYTDFLTKIKEIPPYLFQNGGIKGVLTIPANIQRIGYGAFSGCYGLTKIVCATRPDGSKLIIDDYAFYNCPNVTEITLADTETVLGHRALAFAGDVEKEDNNSAQ